MSQVVPVILAGGGGTRLWPVSRALRPKQFFALAGAQSLFQTTLARVADAARFAAPIVICNEEHRFLVAEQLRELDIAPAAILLEPVGRNTAPAAGLAALHALTSDPAAKLLLLPSDHALSDVEAFHAAADRAVQAAGSGWLVTFGISPDRPETGYGYIKRGGRLPDVEGCDRVAEFVEKPNHETASRYLSQGNYVWNSGMFLMPAGVLLEELDRFEPDVVKAGRQALAGARRDLDFLRLDADAFAASPAVSIDYGVMERTERAAVVPAAFGWSDVGSWSALWQIRDKDADGNAVEGDVVTAEARDCLLRSDDRLLAAIGVRNLVVVATEDAVLVCSQAHAQEVGRLVERLKSEGRSEPLAHTRVLRPWGSYRGVDHGERFQVKRITVDPGCKLSLQRHRHRAEHWVVVEGEAEVTCDDRVFRLRPNESTYIPLGAVHRLANPGDTPLHLIEVQSGDYLGEDDIERLDDVYGRG